MREVDVPNYIDPEDFENGNASYPCNTQWMIYKPLVHKYYLTEQAINYYGIDVERKYISDNPNKMEEFINLVTKKVYDYICYRCGWNCFATIMYRIAKGYVKNIDQYTARKEFENALVSEAKFLIDNGDSARYAKENLEKGIYEVGKPEDKFFDTSDIAPETKRALHFLGFDRWFSLVQTRRFNTDEY